MGSRRVGHLLCFRLHFHFHALEKEMATHSSVLAWRIPGTAEPGGLPSVGLHRVRHDWSDLAAAAAAAMIMTSWNLLLSEHRVRRVWGVDIHPLSHLILMITILRNKSYWELGFKDEDTKGQRIQVPFEKLAEEKIEHIYLTASLLILGEHHPPFCPSLTNQHFLETCFCLLFC